MTSATHSTISPLVDGVIQPTSQSEVGVTPASIIEGVTTIVEGGKVKKVVRRIIRKKKPTTSTIGDAALSGGGNG